MFYLEGDIGKECNFDLRELHPEGCGLGAAVNVKDASRYVYITLALLEHRGERSAGIVSRHDQGFKIRRRKGNIKKKFHNLDFQKRLKGEVAIGHNRYPTQGDSDSLTNVQPLFFDKSRFGKFALGHNGTFVCDGISRDLCRDGALFQSTTDSELFAHLMTRSKGKNFIDAIKEAAKRIPAAYSMLFITKDLVVALRDRYGVRPLSLAKLEDGYLVSSENYVFDQIDGCEQLGDVKPGEMVVFSKSGLERIQFAEPDPHFCVFENIYFQFPLTTTKGVSNEDFRMELGKQICLDNSIKGDIVVPVLDSGKFAAVGLANQSGIRYTEAFVRIHDPPGANNRSFTSSTDRERKKTVHLKLHLDRDKVKGKEVVVVDDSIVRSTTMKILVDRLRKADAKSITVVVSSPAITNTCPYGMDFQTKKEIIAYNKDIEQIRDNIGADVLIYQTLSGLHSVVKRTTGIGICTGCFGGRYPTSCRKDALRTP